jgi:hypothetical protein
MSALYAVDARKVNHHTTDTYFDTGAVAAFAADTVGSFDAGAGVATTVGVTPPLTNVLYLAEGGPCNPSISVMDINQGQIGDCFLLSSIGEIALNQPSFISNMIHVNANGTETVKLYCPGTIFVPVSITVTNTFPTYSVNNGSTQDVLNGQKEIWVQVLEKAVATRDNNSTTVANYNTIANGGSPLVALDQLTGKLASAISPYQSTATLLSTLIADQKAGDLLVFDTNPAGALSNGLFNWHAYMFEGVTGTGANAVVHLGNPWGYYQPTPIPIANVSHDFNLIAVDHV